MATHDRGAGRRLVAVGVHLRGHRGGLQVERTGGVHRFKRQGAGIDPAPRQASVAQQSLQRLFGTERTLQGRCLYGRQFQGVDHALAGGTAEGIERLGQGLARLGEPVQCKLLGGKDTRGSSQGRKRRETKPERDATVGELHGR
ncbi:hypothetical protein D3C79_917900 [compost metagenome]